jgi:hypothetical protein
MELLRRRGGDGTMMPTELDDRELEQMGAVAAHLPIEP